MRKIVIHPLLFAAFPILFLLANNATEVRLVDLWFPLLLSVGITLAVQVVIGLFYKQKDKTGLLLTIFLLLLFSFGHLPQITPLFGFEMGSFATLRNKLALIVFGLAWIVLAVSILKSRCEFKGWTPTLNIISLGLVLFQIVTAGMTISARTDSLPGSEKVAVSMSENSGENPDIYYIIVDAFGRNDILKEIYDYDDGEFLSKLKSLGFFIADSSYSNYAQTLQSLPSSLNMEYVHDLVNFPPEHEDRQPLEILFQGNKVVRDLKAAGYKIVCFASGYDGTEFRKYDHFYAFERDASEFAALVFRTTPLPILTGRSLHDEARRRITYAFEKLPQLPLEVESPFFAFAHIISPHPPFMFDENGNDFEPDRVYYRGDGHHFLDKGGSPEEYLIGYRNQVKAIGTMTVKCVREILKNSERPPVIVLQADHGPGSMLRWDSSERTYMKERFSILNAYYLPGIDSSQLYASISPVNSFRIVFNSYFSTDYKLLADSSFFSVWKFPYQFENITERLDQPVQEKMIPLSP